MNKQVLKSYYLPGFAISQGQKGLEKCQLHLHARTHLLESQKLAPATIGI